MKIWVVKTSEMLATDSGSGRVLRSGIVAHMLAGRGHDVTWWMSTFDHANRRNRADQDRSMPLGEFGSIRMIYSPGYRDSISLARMYDHWLWGRAFRRAIRRASPPDIIFCAYPTIESAAVCVRYGQEHHVPVVLDVRDMWPDILAEAVPRPLRLMARAPLSLWRVRARAALQKADALFAISEEFLTWALVLAGRGRRKWDAAFRLAYSLAFPPPEDATEAPATDFWNNQGVARDDSFNIVFVGSITRRRFEMDVVLQAARQLELEGVRAKFILAGDGDDLPYYRKLAQDCSNVLFPGWLNSAQIRELLNRSHLGLVPYRNTPDLVMSVPNKVGEYLAAGLPVATSLTGTLSRLVCERQCGLLFEATQPATLSGLVRRLQGDETLRLALSANARRTYHDELAAETVYGRLIDRLEAMAAAKASTAVGVGSARKLQSIYE